jgi:hypothetical protein
VEIPEHITMLVNLTNPGANAPDRGIDANRITPASQRIANMKNAKLGWKDFLLN